MRALFPTTAVSIDSLLAMEAVASTTIESARYVFPRVPSGSYFVWGIQPHASDKEATHWWTAMRRPVASANSNASSILTHRVHSVSPPDVARSPHRDSGQLQSNPRLSVWQARCSQPFPTMRMAGERCAYVIPAVTGCSQREVVRYRAHRMMRCLQCSG